MSEESILEGCELLEGGNAFERARENTSWVLKELHRGNSSCPGRQVVLTASLARWNLCYKKKESQVWNNYTVNSELFTPRFRHGT